MMPFYQFEKFCQELNSSPWKGTICEVGVGVPFQYHYLNVPGASQTVLMAHSPYNRKFQELPVEIPRSVCKEAAISLAVSDFNKAFNYQFPGTNRFALSATGSYKTVGEEGESHGWVSLVKRDSAGEMEYYSFHWKAVKEWPDAMVSTPVPIGRISVGEYLCEYMIWFIRKILLNHWNTWKEAIEELPNINDVMTIDVLDVPGLSIEDHLLLVRPSNPILYHQGTFKRPADFIRKYSRCYRGSFNPPTLAHEDIGYGAFFEISSDNARKGKVSFEDLAHRIKMINLIDRPVLITAGFPLFVDLHKLILANGANSMEYLVGVDTFNDIMNPKYIRPDPDFFGDFDPKSVRQSGKFLVLPREGLTANPTDQIAWAPLSANYTNVSATEVRAGNLNMVSEKIKNYILENHLYGN